MPGRVPAISTDTRIISGRVSVLNAGTRPGTIDHSSPRIFRGKYAKREFSLGKENFLREKSLLKKFSFFSEIFLFLFVSLQILFQNVLMKPSYRIKKMLQ